MAGAAAWRAPRGASIRILLVNPPRSPHNGILEHAPAEAIPFIHKKLVGPPLGLLTVAAAVRDHDVELLELKGEYDLVPDAPPPRELVRRHVERCRPDVVGVTFIASEFPAGMEILREVKRCDPRTLTVAGGLHATLCPEHFDDPVVDVVVPGPGAHAFRDIVRAREAGQPLASVGGILVRGAHGLVPTATPATARDPAGDDFLMPDRSLLRRWLSTYRTKHLDVPSTYVFTSLGCPHRCRFCSIWPQHGGEFRQRDVESVVAELGTLDDYGVVRFADANTIVDVGFIERLFRRIAEEGIRKIFVMDIRIDTAASHPQLIERLARGGLKVAITGIESFRQEELGGYEKGFDVRLIDRAIDVFRSCGILVRGNYIVPPDYTEPDFAALAEFSAARRLALAGYTVLTPMPGTPFYREVQDRIVDHDLAKYTFFDCVMRSALPREEFLRRVGALWLIREGEMTA